MVIHTFKTNKGKNAILRYPTIGDIESMTTYINTLSQEDTYITLSGETLTYEEEDKYIRGRLNEIALGNVVSLLCFVDDTLVGNCGIERHSGSRKRGLHIGDFGISIAKEYRGEGIGEELARKTIEEAKKNIPNLKIIRLNVYEPNIVGQNLYKKLGFKDYGRLPGGALYKGEYYDDIEMYLPLF